MKITSVYIHIPFCKYICSYCDFCKKFVAYYDVDQYLNLLEEEISLYINKPILIKTLYIGGGTPSILTKKQLKRLKKIIDRFFIFEQDYEFSFEMNPDDINEDYLKQLQKLGVNRVSVGIQTLNNKILKELGRNYDDKLIDLAIRKLIYYFENISLDFMFNLPFQTKKDYDDIFNFLKKYQEIKNISFYSLILSENTKLFLKDYQYLNEDEEAKIYEYIQKNLEQLGYNQYETSNFSKKGYEAQHNFVYWRNQQYYGFGLGASGYYHNLRYQNVYSLNNYKKMINENKKPYACVEEISDYLKRYETIMLGLRTCEGIDYQLVKKMKLDEEKCDIIDNKLKIKKEYFFIQNEIIINLLNQLEE